MWSSRIVQPNRVRLGLEWLDSRIAPSGYNPDSYPDSEPDDPPEVIVYGDPQANAAPQIVNFVASAGIGGIWEFSGQVLDESPGGLTITFGGEPETLQGVTVVTDANGFFTLTISLRTDGSDDGTATVRTSDAQGLQSNVASCNIHPS